MGMRDIEQGIRCMSRPMALPFPRAAAAIAGGA